jgi:hypothetical protein
MAWLDHVRRTASVVLVALALVTVPAVASATFTGSSSGGLTASTAQLVAPASVSGTYRCISGGSAYEGFEATVSGFADSGPAGETYTYAVLRGTTTVKTATSTARTATVGSGNLPDDGTTTRWTLTIQATLGTWTGPVYTRTVTCAAQGASSGLL